MAGERELTPLERAVLSSAIADEPALIAQMPGLFVTRRDYADGGCFVDLAHSNGARGAIGPATRVLRGPHAAVPGLEYGIGFLIYVDEGVLTCIEAHMYGDEKWPPSVDGFQLT